jgi:hypothetical protein
MSVNMKIEKLSYYKILLRESAFKYNKLSIKPRYNKTIWVNRVSVIGDVLRGFSPQAN